MGVKQVRFAVVAAVLSDAVLSEAQLRLAASAAFWFAVVAVVLSAAVLSDAQLRLVAFAD